jgi:hypothetical protein
MITETIQTILASTKKVDQGTIEIHYVGPNAYELRYPDSTSVKVKGRNKAYSVARAWFQNHIGANEIGIGRIEWHS